jgi:hypothetical protein
MAVTLLLTMAVAEQVGIQGMVGALLELVVAAVAGLAGHSTALLTVLAAVAAQVRLVKALQAFYLDKRRAAVLEAKQVLLGKTQALVRATYIVRVVFMAVVAVVPALPRQLTSAFSAGVAAAFVLFGVLGVRFPQQAREICKWNTYYLTT